jgi:hypothetical protein
MVGVGTLWNVFLCDAMFFTYALYVSVHVVNDAGNVPVCTELLV